MDEDNNNTPTQGNETVPLSIAYTIFGILAVLIVCSFVFAGYSIVKFANRHSGAVLDMGKVMVYAEADAPFDETEAELGELEESELLQEGSQGENQGEQSQTGEFSGELSQELENILLSEEPTEAPEEEPEPTPRRVPRPTPAPEPELVPCRTCNATGLVVCVSCNGVGGGRGVPQNASFPYEVAPVSDVWWCTICNATARTACRACGGSGSVLERVE
ncbi:MAG: hypothetical protein FWG87_00230 [Defluviitaleaceae bacterium]|nr:hypothetical protein [Defluviitaleaceae bacterium]